MKAWISGTEVEGTPKEILDYKNMNEAQQENQKKEQQKKNIDSLNNFMNDQIKKNLDFMKGKHWKQDTFHNTPSTPPNMVEVAVYENGTYYLKKAHKEDVSEAIKEGNFYGTLGEHTPIIKAPKHQDQPDALSYGLQFFKDSDLND